MYTSIRVVFVICNNSASDQRISLFDRLQHARYEHHIVVASVYKRLEVFIVTGYPLIRRSIMSQLSVQKISATLWMFFLRHLHLQMTVTRNFPSADILQKLITNFLTEVVRKTVIGASIQCTLRQFSRSSVFALTPTTWLVAVRFSQTCETLLGAGNLALFIRRGSTTRSCEPSLFSTGGHTRSPKPHSDLSSLTRFRQCFPVRGQHPRGWPSI
jgi:hypothetical protein